MKILIDTNVLISCVWRDRTPEEVVLFVVDNEELEWVASAEIVAEYVEVLKRPKFGLSAAEVERWENIINEAIQLVDEIEDFEFRRDPKDAKFLRCAISAEADILVTGDRDFEEATALAGLTILTARKFKEQVIDKWKSDS